jgi:hypothetical protein
MGSAGGVIAVVLANIVAIFLMRDASARTSTRRGGSDGSRSLNQNQDAEPRLSPGTIGFLIFFPILWIIVLSFKTEDDAIRAPLEVLFQSGWTTGELQRGLRQDRTISSTSGTRSSFRSGPRSSALSSRSRRPGPWRSCRPSAPRTC